MFASAFFIFSNKMKIIVSYPKVHAVHCTLCTVRICVQADPGWAEDWKDPLLHILRDIAEPSGVDPYYTLVRSITIQIVFVVALISPSDRDDSRHVSTRLDQ
jgi:hypothetical protein